MRRVSVSVLVVAMLASLLGANALAKKTPSRATNQSFFLRTLKDTCAPDSLSLTVEDGPDTQTCGSQSGGLINEAAFIVSGGTCDAGGQPSCEATTFIAVDGLPLILDSNHDITGRIGVSSFIGGPNETGSGVGQATLVVHVSGTAGGKTVSIGEATADYTITPAQRVAEVEFSADVPAELHRTRFTSLQLTLYNRGATVSHGWYEVEHPASFITIPVFK